MAAWHFEAIQSTGRLWYPTGPGFFCKWFELLHATYVCSFILKNNFNVVVLAVDFSVLLNSTVKLFVLGLSPLLSPLLVKYQLRLREQFLTCIWKSEDKPDVVRARWKCQFLSSANPKMKAVYRWARHCDHELTFLSMYLMVSTPRYGLYSKL